jgi:MFS family permease
VFKLNQLDSGLLLTQFLIGVPVGAAVGGLLAGRIGNRLTGALGIALSAAAFVQMSGWPADELSLHTGPLRQADVALAICGLGFGLVIAPLTAAVLGLTRGQVHGLSTSLVVLARTMGMLVGLSVLTAFGLHRFHQILGTPVLTDPDLRARVKHLEQLVAAAFLQEYREIFVIAAALCVAAAVVIAFALPPTRKSGGI